MAKLPVYLIPAPIGSFLSDMALSSITRIERTPDLFVESEGRVVQELRRKGAIGARHRLHIIDDRSPELAEAMIAEGRPFAILADTGTPCFVDPGHQIVRRILDRHLERVRLVPLGMSSALDAALACAGLDIQRFAFLGHHPECVDYALARGHSRPAVLYVAGFAAGSWLRSLEENLPGWRRITLFRNLRDRSQEGIARFRRGEAPPAWIEDRPGDDYVVVVERQTLDRL